MPKVRGWKFPIQVDDSTGKIKMVDDNENVKQGIKIILKTQKGERKMRPYFGTDMTKFMFNNINLLFVNEMVREVSQSIKLWENHVKQLSVNVSQDAENNTKVNVDVAYVTDIIPNAEFLSTSISENDIWSDLK